MHQLAHSTDAPPNNGQRRDHSDWQVLKRLFPYLWQYRWRVLAALLFMVGAKLANVGVPVLLKHLVDAMNVKVGDAQALVVVPVALLLTYGLLRFSTTLFTELRELVFAKATEGATRHIALQVFRHLHDLSLRFHLDRQTGGMTRDIERGTRGVQSLISFSLYSIFPTLIEVILVLSILGTQFDQGYVWITLSALVAYGIWTVKITEWRTRIGCHGELHRVHAFRAGIPCRHFGGKNGPLHFQRRKLGGHRLVRGRQLANFALPQIFVKAGLRLCDGKIYVVRMVGSVSNG